MLLCLFILGHRVLCNGSDHMMADSDHEEADTRIVLHVIDALRRGANKIIIRTVDSDDVIILIGQFYIVIDEYPNAVLWVAFGTGKHFRYYSINTICAHLGRLKSCCLPPFIITASTPFVLTWED